MTISTEWGVWIQGMDEVLPALGRRDAVERAHKANEASVWNERHPGTSPNWELFAPIVWAVPCRYGEGSPIGERSGYPVGWTEEQVEDAWKRWAGAA